jgi:KUP system potassium uptake protein
MEPIPTPEAVPTEPRAHAPAGSLRNRLALAVAALGVVYGDLGTNVLFALRECFKPEPEGLSPTPENVLSVLSLVFWAFALVVMVKYLTVVLRADNHGEGGILALLALLLGREQEAAAPAGRWSRRGVLMFLGIFGTALLLADGVITPSISVLSAVEGLGVAAPGLRGLIIPATVFILIGLFLVQRFGTARLGRYFGPTMLVWFAAIALAGLPWVVRQPEVLAAFNPWHIVHLFARQPAAGFFLLGAIILCVAGAEALYADMGHFGPRPIRLAWYLVALPALLLNYFGQGAYVLAQNGQIIETNAQGVPETVHLFYELVPAALLYPMMILATLATIIASQALITGAYSLAEQAVQLGYSPRLTVVHTSGEVMGQIYVPFVNWMLMIACVLLVLLFKESTHLANAYGIAVVGTMVITSLLIFEVMRVCWGWPLPAAAALVALFLAVDLPLLASNLTKVLTGGWVPLLFAVSLLAVMMTWRKGRAVLTDPLYCGARGLPLDQFLREITQSPVHRDEETAVVMTAAEDFVPETLLETLERMHVMPGRLVLFTVRAQPIPRVKDEDAIEVRDHGNGCYGVTARHGFMEEPDICRFLALCARKGLELDPHAVYFYLCRMTIVATGQAPLSPWRKLLFTFLYHNAKPATSYYRLPPNRVVELGRLVEL